MTVLNQLQIPTWQLSTLAAVSCEESSIITCYDWPEAFFSPPFFENNTKRKHIPSAVIMYAFSLNYMECYRGNAGKKKPVFCNSRKQHMNKKRKTDSQNSAPRLLLCEAVRKHYLKVFDNKNNWSLPLIQSHNSPTWIWTETIASM